MRLPWFEDTTMTLSQAQKMTPKDTAKCIDVKRWSLIIYLGWREDFLRVYAGLLVDDPNVADLLIEGSNKNNNESIEHGVSVHLSYSCGKGEPDLRIFVAWRQWIFKRLQFWGSEENTRKPD